MPSTTPQERLALGVTALLLAAGAGARIPPPDPPAPEWTVSSPSADTSSIDALGEVREEAGRAVEREREASRPLRPGERIDPNRATATQLERLPGVGPALAGRIVAHRRASGPFRSLADLDAVSGVGPALLAEIGPLLTLEAAPPASTAAGLLDLNRATAEQLAGLPGIGPALAGRIVEWRARHGRFRSVAELEKVPGIGPVLVERLAPLVRVDP